MYFCAPTQNLTTRLWEDPETVNARFFMLHYHGKVLMGNLSREKISEATYKFNIHEAQRREFEFIKTSLAQSGEAPFYYCGFCGTHVLQKVQ